MASILKTVDDDDKDVDEEEGGGGGGGRKDVLEVVEEAMVRFSIVDTIPYWLRRCTFGNCFLGIFSINKNRYCVFYEQSARENRSENETEDST